MSFSKTKNIKKEFVPFQAYIDLVEEDQQITVFDKIGMNWKNCTKVFDPKTGKDKCKEAKGWPSRDAQITVLGEPVKAKTVDPLTGEDIEETYVKVKFKYSRLGEDDIIHDQEGEGYIELYNLSKKSRKGFFSTQNSSDKIKTFCPPDHKNPNAETKKIQEVTKPLAESIGKLDITKAAKELNQIAGFCPVKPANEFPKNLKPKVNSYDDLILPGLRSATLPKILNEDGQEMSHEDLINIDSMARTLYGEMGKCFRYGLQYPIAVAKVIVNRANDKKHQKTFIQPPHDPNKPKLSKAATTLSQFSMWQKTATLVNKKTKETYTGPNGPLHQGLCPPRERGQPFYGSKEASQFENDIWTNALRISTEAVLSPKQFEKRTEKLTETNYTSNLAKDRNTAKLSRGARFINKMDQVFPVIEGRKIDNNVCLEVWKEK